MLQSQGGVCAICLKEKALVIDHCHATMKVRGLLCHFCNTRLYLLESDWIKNAEAYLDRHKNA